MLVYITLNKYYLSIFNADDLKINYFLFKYFIAPLRCFWFLLQLNLRQLPMDRNWVRRNLPAVANPLPGAYGVLEGTIKRIFRHVA